MSLGVLLIAAAFAAAFLGVFAVNLLLVDVFQSDRREALARINQELMNQQRMRAKQDLNSRPKGDDFEEVLRRAAEEANVRKGLLQRFDETIYQSGLSVTKWRVFFNASLCGAITGLAGMLLVRSPAVAGLLGGLGATLPVLYVSFARRRRMNKILAQLPDALELMSRVLRAGQSISQGIKAVADEFKPPIAMEFGYCYEQQNLGLAPEVALHELSKRAGLLEMRIFVLAVLVHKQSGGNLTSMLDSIARVVRERFRLRVEIKSLTAEGRLQAIALVALPLVMWFGLFLIVRDYALKLFDHPPLIAVTALGMLMGAAWIRRIVNFEF